MTQLLDTHFNDEELLMLFEVLYSLNNHKEVIPKIAEAMDVGNEVIENLLKKVLEVMDVVEEM
jgi:hypothetical protein